MKSIRLQAGDSHRYTDSHGNEYVLSAQRFERHDHRTYPLYYMDYPLNTANRISNAGKIVVTIECPTDGYPNPYAAAVEKTWAVARPYIDLFFELQSDDRPFVQCTIEQHDLRYCAG